MTKYTEKKLKDTVLYLISLYYKTDCKYSCTWPKINKLLTIYTICNIVEIPITHKFFCITDDYIGFKDTVLLFPMLDVYTKPYCEDDGLEINDPLNDNTTIPPFYKKRIDNITLLYESDKKILEQIFRKFGAYDIHKLASKIDELKTILPFEINCFNGADLNSDKLLRFLKKNKDNYIENEVLTFIKEYHGIHSSKTKESLKEHKKENKYKEKIQKELVEKCKKISKSPKQKRIAELTKLLELVDELANLENSSLEEIADAVYKKRSLKK